MMRPGDIALDPVRAEVRIDSYAIQIEHHVQHGRRIFRGERGGNVAEPRLLPDRVGGRGRCDERKGVRDEIFARGEDDKFAGRSRDQSEGHGAVVGTRGPDVEIGGGAGSCHAT